MTERPFDTFRRLWTGSPLWRQSVIFVVLAGMVFWAGDRSPSPPPCCTPPPPTPVPLDPTLLAYKASYDAVERDTIGQGVRCERITNAFQNLPLGLQASKDIRIVKYLQEGDFCQKLIASSDKRFDAVETALGAVTVNTTRATIEAIGRAAQAIDAEPFDNTRSGYAEIHANALKYIKMLQDADARFDAISQALRNRAPLSNQLLLQATGAILPMDENIATSEEKSALQRARQAVVETARSQLDIALDTLPSNPTLINMRTILDLYRIVKNAPSGTTSILDQTKLDVIKSVEDELSASDERMRKIVKAVSEWGKRHDPSTCEAVNTAFEALQFIDTTRLTLLNTTDDERAAKAAYDQAFADDLILSGAKKWEKLNLRRKIPIFVHSQKNITMDKLGNALRRYGFNVLRDEKSASLVFDVTAAKPSQVESTSMINTPKWVAKLSVSVGWVCGGKFEFPSNIESDSDDTGQREVAVDGAIEQFAAKVAEVADR